MMDFVYIFCCLQQATPNSLDRTALFLALQKRPMSTVLKTLGYKLVNHEYNVRAGFFNNFSI